MHKDGVGLSIRQLLSQFDETITVTGRISRDLELTKRLYKERTKPVLFENLDGFHAVGNLWSTRERIAKAMNTTSQELTGKMMEAMSNPSAPPEIDNAPFDKNIRADFDLRESAIPKFYPSDGGRLIT